MCNGRRTGGSSTPLLKPVRSPPPLLVFCLLRDEDREAIVGDGHIPDTTAKTGHCSSTPIYHRIAPRRPCTHNQSAIIQQGQTAGKTKERWAAFVAAESQPFACTPTARTPSSKPRISIFASAGYRRVGRHRQGGHVHTRSDASRSWSCGDAEGKTESREGERVTKL